MLTILSFILVVFPIIIIHEFAHFIVGKYMGADPKEFAVALGKPIFKFNWLGAVFKVGWIPVGGYVKFGKYQFAQEKMEATQERMPQRKWIPVILAGPLSNFISAFLALVCVFTYVLSEVKLVTITPQIMSKNVELTEKSTVIYIGSNQRVKKFIGGLFNTKEEYFQVSQDVKVKTLDFTGIEMIPLKDISFSKSLTASIGLSSYSLVMMAKLTTEGIIDVFTSLTGYKNLSGPIGISVEAKKAQDRGFLDMVLLFAVISFAVGFFNLLPLSILDGGRIFLGLIEMVTKKDIPQVSLGIFNIISLGLILSLFLMGTISDILRMFVK